MKLWLLQGAVLVGVLGLLWGVMHLQDEHFRARDADRYEEKQHHDKCLAARVPFFEHCLKLDQRAECETMWVQKRGIVFDGEAEKPWTDEIDCSMPIRLTPND